ncbi:MAG: hypothetical protein FJ267_15185, partial [Planctomycetes bacterium]|nr:hypothetical protein [Planctomycetota bacterium]
GEIFEYAGDELTQRKGWPPVMEGVSRNAREVQTLAIYDGDLHAGVWPWAEVWRYDRNRTSWRFEQRMFSHPKATDQVTHPYEAETKAVDPVYNLWGQRVTGMVPIGDGMIITTSSKTSGVWDSKFAFLSPEQVSDYGATYKVTRPGNLAVFVPWKESESRFEFEFHADRVLVRRDSVEVGTIRLKKDVHELLKKCRIVWGQGVYGPCFGKLSQHESSLEGAGVLIPFKGAYFHPHQFLKSQDSPDVHQKTIDDIVDRHKTSGLNAVMPFVSTSSGEAFYPSDVMSTRKYPDSDPIDMMLRSARERGLQTYPVIPVTVCGNEHPSGILLQHPEWALRYEDGSPVGYLSPTNPDARKYMLSVVREIVSRYHPDGVILDYIRFHNRPVRLDEASEKRFQATLPAAISDSDRKVQFQEFKEAELRELVRMIREEVR